MNADRRHIHHIVKFHKNDFKRVLFIQILIFLPYLISLFFKNYLPIIIGMIFTYFFVIYFFQKK